MPLAGAKGRLAALLVALPAAAQDQFDEATRVTAAAYVEHLRPEQLPPCVLAFARQVRQLQAIVRDRGKRPEAVEEGVSIIAGNQIAAAPFCWLLAETPRGASCGP